jgi:hypothetical protein
MVSGRAPTVLGAGDGECRPEIGMIVGRMFPKSSYRRAERDRGRLAFCHGRRCGRRRAYPGTTTATSRPVPAAALAACPPGRQLGFLDRAGDERGDTLATRRAWKLSFPAIVVRCMSAAGTLPGRDNGDVRATDEPLTPWTGTGTRRAPRGAAGHTIDQRRRRSFQQGPGKTQIEGGLWVMLID